MSSLSGSGSSSKDKSKDKVKIEDLSSSIGETPPESVWIQEKEKEGARFDPPIDAEVEEKFKVSDVPKLWNQLQMAIIRPPRFIYKKSLLGPEEFLLGETLVQRIDIQLTNKRGLKVQATHFRIHDAFRSQKQLPVVIYGHGNCGSRVDSLPCIEVLIPSNIEVFAIDFSGSGLSEGEYVSLGLNEKDDLGIAVEYLRRTESVSTIGLWGRSMGAMASIMYAAEDPSIAGVVLDSPFTSLMDLTEDVVASWEQSKWIPKFIVNSGVGMIRKAVKKKAGIDIRDLDAISKVPSCFIPALFVHGEQDDFIQPKHSAILSAAYGGDKNYVAVPGDHNSDRPQFFHDSVTIFFNQTLLGGKELSLPPPESRKVAKSLLDSRPQPVQRFNPMLGPNQLASLLAPESSYTHVDPFPVAHSPRGVDGKGDGKGGVGGDSEVIAAAQMQAAAQWNGTELDEEAAMMAAIMASLEDQPNVKNSNQEDIDEKPSTTSTTE